MIDDKTTYEASKMLAELGLSQELLIRHEYWNKPIKQKVFLDDIEHHVHDKDDLCLFIPEDGKYYDELLWKANHNYYRAYSFFELWEMLPQKVIHGIIDYSLSLDKEDVIYLDNFCEGQALFKIDFSDYPNEADALAHLIKELIENKYMEI